MENQERVQNQWAVRRRKLRAEIEECLNRGVPPEINLSIPRHSITAPVLREFAYDERFRGRTIPVVFGDSSRPAPFPIGCLATGPAPTASQEVLKLGLSSARHPDMDYLVDLHLIRNKDLNDETSMAAAEAFAYRRTVEVLDDPALDMGGELAVLHTGLEPMVVGFYRGVIKVLQNRKQRALPRTLVVRPWLYPLGPTSEKIGPNSPGANLASYIAAEPWW